MQKNYIILAHKNPQQIRRLVERLEDGNSQFFIHVDLKSRLQEFEVLKNCKNTFIIEERINCIWGDFSIVKATLLLLKAVVESGGKGFTILMSGQDYPIVSNQQINSFLTENKDFNFINIIPIEEKWSEKMVRDKVEHYHFLHSEQKSDSNSYAPFHHSSVKQKARNIVHFIKGRMSYKTFCELLRLPKRKPFYTHQFSGSQWWAFNEQTTEVLYEYIKRNFLELENYYQFTSAPDEIFFQSVLMNLIPKNSTIKIKPSLTYVNWHRKNVVLPVTFNINDFDELCNTNYLFARKFDMDYDNAILDKLDEEICNIRLHTCLTTN